MSVEGRLRVTCAPQRPAECRASAIVDSDFTLGTFPPVADSQIARRVRGQDRGSESQLSHEQLCQLHPGSVDALGAKLYETIVGEVYATGSAGVGKRDICLD